MDNHLRGFAVEAAKKMWVSIDPGRKNIISGLLFVKEGREYKVNEAFQTMYRKPDIEAQVGLRCTTLL